MIIGTLKEHVDAATGEITMRGGLSFGGKDVEIVARQPDGKAPDALKYRVFEVPGSKFARGDNGAIWENTSRATGDKFLSLEVTSTRLSGKLVCGLTPANEDGERAIVWNHPKPKPEGAAA